MGRLTQADRDSLPDSAFAGPDRSYPMGPAVDKLTGSAPGAHAANAKARAAQNAAPALEVVIDARANKALHRDRVRGHRVVGGK